jgi:hypothetical protein
VPARELCSKKVVQLLPFALPLALLGAAASPPQYPELFAGIKLVNEGDFEAGLTEFQRVAKLLLAQAPPGPGLPMAHVYIGVCYLELEQAPAARDHFRQAQCLDPTLRLDARSFSTQVLREYTAARDETCGRPSSVPAPDAARAVAAKHGSSKPLLIVLGGGAAAAGAVLAGRGGGGGGSDGAPISVTTTVPPSGGSPSTSTTLAGSPSTTLPSDTTPTAPPSTTLPPPDTTTPGTTVPPGPTTTTTLPPPTTTTTTTATTVPPTTTTTTTTAPPACTFHLSPASQSFGLGGGTGTCDVSSTAKCAWTADTNANWMKVQGSKKGSGNGTITFRVDGLSAGSRSGQVYVNGNTGSVCTVNQGVTLQSEPQGALVWTSDLAVSGATAQVVVNGAQGAFLPSGITRRSMDGRPGVNRLEAQLVTSQGRPGTWRFELEGSFEPGSLRVVAGDVLALTDRTVLFRLSGRPGERVLLVYRTSPPASH